MACKCGNEKCKGFFLLHSKELYKMAELEQKELLKDPECTFELLTSPSSGEIFNTFKELHVRGKIETED